MALQIITVVLFTVFFSEALTLVCYNCTKPATCTENATCFSNSQCSSMTTYYGGNTVDVKQCANSSLCVNSSISLGWAEMFSQCCSSDLCNNVTASDLVNELKCYICNGIECSNTQTQCKGGENRCITTTVGSHATNYIWKGCASSIMCDSSTLLNSTLNSLKSTLPNSPLYSDLRLLSFSCCGANLCNNMTRGPVSAGSSTFPPIFHLRPDLGFLLILLVFGCSVLSM